MRWFKILLTLFLITGLCCGCDDVFDTQSFDDSATASQNTVSVVSVSNSELPTDSYDCTGQNYLDTVNLFENAGFTNVSAIPQNSDKTKETRVNESVIAVLVNNNVIFSKGALYNSDVEIKIYYVVSDITENVSSATETTSSNVSSSTSGLNSDKDNNHNTDSTVDNNNGTNNTTANITAGSDGSTQSSDNGGTTVTEQDNQSNTVWVTEKGKKYHNKSTCSGMKSPIEISKEQAEQQGYEPCKRCYS